MALAVSVWELIDGQDTHTGTITWDGSTFRCVPDTPSLRHILAEAVPEPGTLRPLYSKHEPEAFLWALHRQYRSAYVRVSAAREV
jgi:hypothetical protein